MSEWRHWPAWRRVMAAAEDRVGSAATVGEAAARAVAALAETVSEVDPEAFPAAVFDAVDLLGGRQAAMAPVVNLRNAVYLSAPRGPEAVVVGVTELADRLAEATKRIGEVGADLVEAGSTVLVHSQSSSVRAVLEEVSRQRGFRVCCTEAQPVGEGVEMASELAALGFEVEVLSDDVAIELLPGMDLVLVGADALGPDRAINKVGTAALAREARRQGVPFYMVAATDKALPAALFERASARWGREELSEVVALELVTAVVTEVGVLEPAEAGKLAAGRRVAPELL